MELWIRSQDKSRLVKVDNLYIGVGNYIGYYVQEIIDEGRYYSCRGELGRYETRERALEVLDEIQAVLILGGLPMHELKEELSKTNVELKDKALFNTKTGVSIYIMPKE